MAWTSSAGPQGACVLDGGASSQNVCRTGKAARRTVFGRRARPLALAATAHLCGFAAISPFAADEPIIALPVLIGLVVSYFSLSRLPSLPMAPEASEQYFNEPTARGKDRPINGNQTAHASPVPPIKLKPTDMPDDLRSELMARVSHELRTPLNAVVGFSDLMGHQMFGPLGHPRYEEYVSHIRESSKKLLKSAEDTLAMTSLITKSTHSSDRETMLLSGLVHDVGHSIITDMHRAGIAVAIDIDRDIEVNAHRRALRQALVNVLHEAANQAETGATVSISATADLDKVAFLITADRIAEPTVEVQRSLPLCLARTLLELDGCSLFENPAHYAPWSVLLSLDGAIQPDFFASTARAVMHAY